MIAFDVAPLFEERAGPVKPPTELSITLPLRTVSELNMHEHWRKRYDRRKKQGAHTCMMLNRETLPPLPATVTFTRRAPRKLDVGDNLNSSMKALRDAIAAMYGVDDGSSLFDWQYEQEFLSGDYEVLLEIKSTQAEGAA